MEFVVMLSDGTCEVILQSFKTILFIKVLINDKIVLGKYNGFLYFCH